MLKITQSSHKQSSSSRKAKPDYAEAWSGKGFSFEGLGKYDEARRYYEKALEIRPNWPSALNNLSEVLLILDKTKKGLQIAEKALTVSKDAQDEAISRFLRISAHLFEGEIKRAQKEIEELTKHLKGLKKDFRVTDWDLSPLMPAIHKRLKAESKKKLLLLISLLKGKIRLEDFLKRD